MKGALARRAAALHPPADAGDRTRSDAAVRLTWTCVAALSGLLLGGPLAALGAALVGWRWEDARRARAERRRREAIRAALPDAIDVLAAATRSGAGVGRAFALAAAHDRGPLGEAMRATVAALDAGVPRGRAYAVLAERAGVPEVRALVAALERAHRLGAPVAVALGEQAREMREVRRARAEEGARSAPVRLLVPVFVCFLPAFALLTIAPVIVVALRSFRGA